MRFFKNGKKLRKVGGFAKKGIKAAGRGAKEFGAGFASGVSSPKRPEMKNTRSLGKSVGSGTRTVAKGLAKGFYHDAQRATGKRDTFEGGAFGFRPAVDVFDVTGRKPVKVARKVRRKPRKKTMQKQYILVPVQQARPKPKKKTKYVRLKKSKAKKTSYGLYNIRG